MRSIRTVTVAAVLAAILAPSSVAQALPVRRAVGSASVLSASQSLIPNGCGGTGEAQCVHAAVNQVDIAMQGYDESWSADASGHMILWSMRTTAVGDFTALPVDRASAAYVKIDCGSITNTEDGERIWASGLIEDRRIHVDLWISPDQPTRLSVTSADPSRPSWQCTRTPVAPVASAVWAGALV